MNDLRELLHESVAHSPADTSSNDDLLSAGRRRVRRRRAKLIGIPAVAAIAAVGLGVTYWPDGTSGAEMAAAGVPVPEGSVTRLEDARAAVAGKDYRVLASYTHENLDAANGEYFDGLTDDGLILFRDAANGIDEHTRFALMDPATGEKDWLPDPGVGQSQTFVLELSDKQIVLQHELGQMPNGDWNPRPAVSIFNRVTRSWSTLDWPTLPVSDDYSPYAMALGPDGRLYLTLDTQQLKPPPGWEPSGFEVDSPGQDSALWSVSLTDSTDVRNEHVRVGSFAFSEGRLVYTDSTNGDAGDVHVRNLATGEETSFNPKMGEKCNLLNLTLSGDRIAMSEYCGKYDGIRDDRVQVLSTDGESITTIQGSDVEGHIGQGRDQVMVEAFGLGEAGTYVYDLGSGEFVKATSGTASYGGETGLVMPADHLIWRTPENFAKGMTQTLVEWLD